MVEVAPQRAEISIHYWKYLSFIAIVLLAGAFWFWRAMGSRWGANNSTMENLRPYFGAGTRAPAAAKQEDNLVEALRTHRIEKIGGKRFVVLFSATNDKGDPVAIVQPGDVSIAVGDASGTKVPATVEKVTPLHGIDRWGERAFFSCVLDWSGSMWVTDLEAQKSDYSAFLSGLSLPFAGAVFKFNSSVERLIGLTSSTAILENAIKMDISQGSTALYNCIDEGITQIEPKPHLLFELLTTDGNDNASNKSLDDVLRRARQKEVSLFVLGFGWVNIDVLKQLAEETDGYYVYVPDSSDLRNFFTRLASIVNNVQVAEFVTSTDFERPASIDLTVHVGVKTLKRSR